MFKLVPLVVLIVAASGRDFTVGKDGGRKIYDENKQASPAIWRQVQNVTVNTTDSEIISRVIITDLRPNKDGEAEIIEGGDGQKNVTIQLRSPAVFRGFDFNVQVFAVPDRTDLPGPFIMTKDINVNDDAPVSEPGLTEGEEITEETDEEDGSESVAHPNPISNDRSTRGTEEENVKELNTQVNPDPVFKYVKDQSTDLNEPQSNVHQFPTLPPVLIKDEFTPKIGQSTDKPVTEAEIDQSTVTADSTTELQEGTTEFNQEELYSEVSKQVGQKIVYGHKKV